ncbi:MAG TPA: hypothetical protein VNV25_19075 [Gemmatimonadaceae bacterium]|jgi:hypothetical protein|nr:hypothetical protein [Gemmatimonadaceae bacterium]
MLVRLTLAAALLALATACTNPTAPSATSRDAARVTSSGDGVTTGGGTHTAASPSGVTTGGGT